MKIGIVTEISYDICNYGNVLQAYALNRFIRDRYKYDSYTIELKEQKKSITSPILFFIKTTKAILVKKKMLDHVVDKEKHDKFINFYNKNIPSIVINRFNDIYDEEIDGYIVGADVVWHQEHAFINSLKFLDFKDNYTPIKLSYAASFGNNWIPKENRKNIKACLKQFKGISVREEAGKKLLNDIGVNNVQHVLDPVFLLSAASWNECAKKPSSNLDSIKNYCLVFLLSPQDYEMDFVRLLRNETDCNIIFVPYSSDSLKSYDLTDEMCVYENCGPEEWIWLIENASYVVTDSFHCIAFSIIFKKQFYAMDRGKMMSRIEDILSKTSLKDRLITTDTIFNNRIDNIDYTDAAYYLDTKLDESIVFLDDCLKL